MRVCACLSRRKRKKSPAPTAPCKHSDAGGKHTKDEVALQLACVEWTKESKVLVVGSPRTMAAMPSAHPVGGRGSRDRVFRPGGQSEKKAAQA